MVGKKRVNVSQEVEEVRTQQKDFTPIFAQAFIRKWLEFTLRILHVNSFGRVLTCPPFLFPSYRFILEQRGYI